MGALRRRRWTRLLALGLLAAGTLAGCSAGGDKGAKKSQEGKLERVLESLPVLFPTVPIALGADGRVATVAGFSSKTIDGLAEDLTGNPLFGRIVYLDRSALEWLDQRDVQHVTVALQPEGIFLLVNGMPLPSLAWEGETLDNLVDLLGKLRDDGSASFHLLSADGFDSVAALVPAISKLNLQLDIHLPDLPQVGESPRRSIPTPTRRAVRALVARQADHSAGDAGPHQLDLSVRYEPVSQGGKVTGWVPSFAGFSTVDLQRMLKSMQLDRGGKLKIPKLMLRKDLQQRLALEGIEQAGLEMRQDGLFPEVNGKRLPHLAWDEDSLSNLSSLLEQLYPEDEALPDEALWVPALRDSAPTFNDYDLKLQVGFPLN